MSAAVGSSSAAAPVTSTHHFFDISQLPSVVKGMSSEEETLKRRKTCRFIEEAGRVLKLPRVAISTAMVFFHRFYAKHAFQDHDRFEVSIAALVLAAKTEEAPKKVNTVIQECYKLKTRAMQAGRISRGGGGTLSPKQHDSTHPDGGTSSLSLDPKGEEFLKLKERILLLERIILHTIGFELSIDHPYGFFVNMIKKLIGTRQLKYNTTKKTQQHTITNTHTKTTEVTNMKMKDIMSKMMNELVQYSMSTANDSYQTSLCLQFGPKDIATACVYLACMLSDVVPADATQDWKTTLRSAQHTGSSGGTGSSREEETVDMEALVSVCVQILDLIAEKKASDTESVRKIRKALELLKNREEQQQQQQQQAAAAASAAAASKGGGTGIRSPTQSRPLSTHHRPPFGGASTPTSTPSDLTSPKKRPRIG